MSLVRKGCRVVRGPDWQYDDQDGGKGHLGTVKEVLEGKHSGLALVVWDRGNRGRYRIGASDKYDLLLCDNAPAGIKHRGVRCTECTKDVGETGDLGGIRWKCMDCQAYELCTPCYMSDKHELNHAFWRFTNASTSGVEMHLRIGCEKSKVHGLLPRARVVHGPDWTGQTEEGSVKREGSLNVIEDMEGCARSCARVVWDDSGGAERGRRYRVGYGGVMELAYTEPGDGYMFYPDHLPVLNKEEGITMKDKVCVTVDVESFRRLQQEIGLEPDVSVIGYFGVVSAKTEKGFRVKMKAGLKIEVNQHTLEKIPHLKPDDRIRVTKDRRRARRLQETHGGWNDSMKKALGKKGKVVNTDKDWDVKISVGGNKWTFNPCLLTFIGRGHGACAEDSSDSSDTSDDDELDCGSDDETEGVMALVEALATATKEGDTATVRDIMASNKELVDHFRHGRAPIHSAIGKKHLDVVRVLVEQGGADVNIPDHAKRAVPLHYAAECGATDVMRYLLEHKADINAVEHNHRTALHVAVKGCHLDVIQLLLEQKPDLTIFDSNGETPFHQAVREDFEHFDVLMKHPLFDPNLKNKKGFNMLHYAAIRGVDRIGRMLAERYPHMINIIFSDGHTALHIACNNGHDGVTKALLNQRTESGDLICEVDAKNDNGATAAALALRSGKSRCVELLLDHGTDINNREKDMDTYLHEAGRAHRDGEEVEDTPRLQKICKTYKKEGVTTPSQAMLCRLVEEGADINAKNQNAKTPLQYVRERPIRELLRKIHASGPRQSTRLSTIEEDAVGDKKDKEEFVKGVRLIHLDNLSFEGRLGEGGFGQVHSATHHKTRVAVKTLYMGRSNIEDIKKEIQAMAHARHDYIVSLYGVCVDAPKSEIHLVMKLMEEGNLGSFIFEPKSLQKQLDYKEKISISVKLLQAVHFLHSTGILHLDIKPSNILLDRSHTPFLCDLGVSSMKSRSKQGPSSSVKGTPKYLPPEVLSSNSRKTKARDVWSIACSLLEMFVEKDLWDNRYSQPVLMRHLLEASDVTPPILEEAPEEVRTILRPCFSKDPTKRPKAAPLHDAFSKLWEMSCQRDSVETAPKTKDKGATGNGNSSKPILNDKSKAGNTTDLLKTSVDSGYSGSRTLSSVKMVLQDIGISSTENEGGETSAKSGPGSRRVDQKQKLSGDVGVDVRQCRSPFDENIVGAEVLLPKVTPISSTSDVAPADSSPAKTMLPSSTPDVVHAEVMTAEEKPVLPRSPDESLEPSKESAPFPSKLAVAPTDSSPTLKMGPSSTSEFYNGIKAGEILISSTSYDIHKQQDCDPPKKTGLPFSETRPIGHEGGTIWLADLDVSLEIPVGALALGVEEDITVRIVPQTETTLVTRAHELEVCPVVDCTPNGLIFEKPVKLTIGHCAIISDTLKAKADVYVCQDTDQNNGFTLVEQDAGGKHSGVQCEVQESCFVLLLDHFTQFGVKLQVGDGVEGKNINITSYTQDAEPLAGVKPIVRTYCHDKRKDIMQEIDNEERKLHFTMAHPRKDYMFLLRCNSMEIYCIDRKKTIGCDVICRRRSNSLDFNLNNSEERLNVEMKAGQAKNPEGLICVLFSPMSIWNPEGITGPHAEKRHKKHADDGTSAVGVHSIIPFSLRKNLNIVLSNNFAAVCDWRNLAAKLGLEDRIDFLADDKERVIKVIDIAEKGKKLTSISQLRDILKVMKREDAVQVIDDYMKNNKNPHDA